MEYTPESDLSVQQLSDEKTSNNQPCARIVAIDRFRGLLMFLNALGYFLIAFPCIMGIASPIGDGKMFEIVKGVTFDDLFLPLFIFVIGLTLCRNFKNSVDKIGYEKSLTKFSYKYLTLIGFGFVMCNGFESVIMSLIKEGYYENAISSKLAALYLCAIALAFIAVFAVLKLIAIKRQNLKQWVNYIAKFVRFIWAVGGLVALYFLIKSTALAVGEKQTNLVWDVFQTIGLAALISLPFAGLNKYLKLLVVAITSICLTVFYCNGGLALGTSIFNGGLIGAIGWAQLILIGGVFRDLSDKKLPSLLLALVMLALSLILIYCTPIVATRRGCSPVYYLFSAGIGGVVWLVFTMSDKVIGEKFKFLSTWGTSTLLTYYITLIVSAVLSLIATDKTSLAVAFVISFVLTAILYLILRILKKKNIYIKI